MTGRLREAALELGKGGESFSAKDLGDRAGVQTYAEQRRIHWMLRDLKRTGELESVERGRYRLGADSRKKAVPQKQEVMWRVLRGKRRVTAEDLMEFAAVSANYAKQWLRMLVKRGVVRDLGQGKYQLVKDSIESPADVEKAEKLRELRARKKAEALAALEVARGRMEETCGELNQALDCARIAMEKVEGARQALTELEEICT